MPADYGFLALVLALILCCFHPFNLFLRIRTYGNFIVSAVSALISAAFISMIHAHITDDFSVLNVYENSHSSKPLIYKITGSWASHEGSMLLWAWVLSCYSFFFMLLCKAASRDDAISKDRVLMVQSLLCAGFLSFIVFSSNPFIRIFPSPADGLGLNPLLQDIGLALHPPILYLGYAGLSLPFSIATAALLKADKNLIGHLRSWSLLPWSFLTLGIGLGSWWAYRELGWGGFWFWDPVESISLMPWLIATALIHTNIAARKGFFVAWALLLAIISFGFSLTGTFLVRSGLLISVHSFASDPKRGLYILLLLACTIGAALFAFILRAKHFIHYKYFTFLSKESAILCNNLLLVVLSLTILLGMTYPFALEYTSGVKVVVGAPYYNKIFGIAALPTLCLAAVSPSISWRREKFKKFVKKFKFTVAGSIVLGLILYPHANSISWAGLVLAGFVLFATIEIICATKLKNLVNLSAVTLGHSGIAIMIIGIITCTTWQQEKETRLSIGDATNIAGFSISLQGVSTGKTDNYHFLRAEFSLENKIILPEIRYYPVEDVKISDTAIFRKLMSDLYFAIESAESTDSILVKIQYRPLINLIWLGCFVIFLSGIAAILRFRINHAQFTDK